MASNPALRNSTAIVSMQMITVSQKPCVVLRDRAPQPRRLAARYPPFARMSMPFRDANR
jgi:hypothetical protein